MAKFFYCAFLSFLIIDVAAQAINGKVTDSQNNDPLPFATIQIASTTIGTVSNKSGEFRIVVPDSLLSKGIQVTYIGFKTALIEKPDTSSFYEIKLEPSITQLTEVVIRPLKPEEYIKKAVNKFPENYAQIPFSTLAYYREKFKENGNFISLHEGVFESYYPSYQDTVPNQHKLALYRTADELHEVAFMHDKALKKEAKERKKAEKKGETYEDDAQDFVSVSFGGPNDILGSDITKAKEDYLDSTKFKKFRYSFAPETTYMGKDMMVIDFESKGTVDHLRITGKIYIDIASEAIALVDLSGDFVIPLAIKPILLAFGLIVHKPIFNKKIHYQPAGAYWYPKTIQMDVNAGLTKVHLFKSNEKSVFDIEQIFSVNQLKFENLQPIDTAMIFKTKKPMAEQVHNNNGLKWEDMMSLLPE